MLSRMLFLFLQAIFIHAAQLVIYRASLIVIDMVLPYRWLAACILLSIATTVRAYSTGVPAAACTRIYPEGHNGTSQNLQSSPYVLDISQFYNQLGNLYYTPGYSYKGKYSILVNAEQCAIDLLSNCMLVNVMQSDFKLPDCCSR